MTWKPIMIFLGGLLIGGSSTFLATRKYYKKKCFEEIERRVKEMEDTYGITDPFARYDGEDSEKENEEVVERSQGTMSQTSRDSMKELHKKRKEADDVDYTKFYGEDEPNTDPAEKESPAEEANREHILHRDDPPELIPEEALGDIPAWVEEETLFYDVEDDRLADENDEDVENPYLHVGDIINKIDFDDPEFTGVFYIWNHAFDVIYTIECI